MQVILPPEVQYSYELEQRLDRLDRMRTRAGWLREFDRALKDIDPNLSLVKASEHADQPGLVPGYWHVRRANPVTVDTYLPLKGPNGEFSEPHSGHLEWLRGSDLQRPGALENLLRRAREQDAERERRLADAKEQRVQEIAERIRVHDSPGVSMTAGWTNSKRGRRGKKK